MNIQFLGIRYHRNGCYGAGFYAVRLRWTWPDEGTFTATAMVFDADEHIGIVPDGEFGPDIMTCCLYEDFASELRAYVASEAAQNVAFVG